MRTEDGMLEPMLFCGPVLPNKMVDLLDTDDRDEEEQEEEENEDGRAALGRGSNVPL